MTEYYYIKYLTQDIRRIVNLRKLKERVKGDVNEEKNRNTIEHSTKSKTCF